MRSTRHSGLMAAAMMMAVVAGTEPAVQFVDAPKYRPSKAKRDTELQRKIADHNAAVEARKAEKKARKAKKEAP